MRRGELGSGVWKEGAAAAGQIILPPASELCATLEPRGFGGGDASAEAQRRRVTRRVWTPGRSAPEPARATVQAWSGVGVYGFGEAGEQQGSVAAGFGDAATLGWRGAAERLGACVSLPEAREVAASALAASLLERAVDAARDAAGDSLRRVAVWLDERETARRIVPWSRSEALAVASRSEAASVLVVEVAMLGQGGEVAAGRFVQRTGSAWEHDAEAAAREAVRRAEHAAESPPLRTARYAARLRPGAAAVWAHEALGHRLEADAPHAFHRGESLPWQITARHLRPACDDEGAPPHETTLIEAGRVVALLGTRRCETGEAQSAYRATIADLPLARQHTLVVAGNGKKGGGERREEGSRFLEVECAAHGAIQGGVVTLESAAGWLVEGQRRVQPFVGVTLRTTVNTEVLALGTDAPTDVQAGTCLKAGQARVVWTRAPSVVLANMAAEQR